MPNLESGKKALRQSKKRTALNKRYKNRIKSLTRELNNLVKEGSKDATEKLASFYKAVDKATKKNIIHKNTAARRKSSMTKTVYRADTEKNKSSQAK